jgi:hypothetical protein
MSGDFFVFGAGAQPYCVTPTHCTQDANFTVTLYPNWGSTETCAGPTTNFVYVNVKRPMATPGERISLPNTRVGLMKNTGDATTTCSEWTGTVTWNSEVPSWSITLDATCSEMGKSGIRLVGTFNGDL